MAFVTYNGITELGESVLAKGWISGAFRSSPGAVEEKERGHRERIVILGVREEHSTAKGNTDSDKVV